jgi:hypothetical protein
MICRQILVSFAFLVTTAIFFVGWAVHSDVIPTVDQNGISASKDFLFDYPDGTQDSLSERARRLGKFRHNIRRTKDGYASE